LHFPAVSDTFVKCFHTQLRCTPLVYNPSEKIINSITTPVQHYNTATSQHYNTTYILKTSFNQPNVCKAAQHLQAANTFASDFKYVSICI